MVSLTLMGVSWFLILLGRESVGGSLGQHRGVTSLDTKWLGLSLLVVKRVFSLELDTLVEILFVGVLVLDIVEGLRVLLGHFFMVLDLLDETVLLDVDGVGPFGDSFEWVFFLFGFSGWEVWSNLFLSLFHHAFDIIVFLDRKSNIISKEFFPSHSFDWVWLEELSDECLSRSRNSVSRRKELIVPSVNLHFQIRETVTLIRSSSIKHLVQQNA